MSLEILFSIKNIELIDNFDKHKKKRWKPTIIIPVIEKIESIGYKWEIGMSSTSPYHYCKIWSIGTIEGISISDAIYEAIIEFIKWYNSK